jgi:putative FmdB family regulatory protein
MPIFEYRCSACGHLEEVLQKLSDPAPATCPACGKGATMGKELSASAFHLKGGGWYKDLYASSSPSSASPSSAAGASSSSASSASGTSSSPSSTTTGSSSSSSGSSSTPST